MGWSTFETKKRVIRRMRQKQCLIEFGHGASQRKKVLTAQQRRTHFSFLTSMNSFSLSGIMMLPVTPLFIALFISEDSTCFVAGVEENTISRQLSFSGMPRSIESIWSSCKGTTLGVISLYRFSKRISRATSVVPYRSQISGIFYNKDVE